MDRHFGPHCLGQLALQRIEGMAKTEGGQLLPRRVDVELHPRNGVVAESWLKA